ncbi:MAG: tyrosine-type recombinase/integrase [Bacteroidaceae bacterium]|nr:tyrosine-type recombinase/integrase [Bacteroidaceae bacterium]
MIQTINGLSYSDSKKYQTAISRGYFEGYESDPRAWKRTFAGVYVTKYPDRTPIMDALREVVGHIPTWEDLTDDNLREFADIISQRYSANTAHSRFADVKSIINEYVGEKPIPSKKYERILKCKGEPSQSVYITIDELRRIINYWPLSDYERYVKKIFIIEALTGARNCDSKLLTTANCDEGLKTITYHSQKTHKMVTLPIWSDVMTFLADKTDMSISLVYFNKLLRDICRRCGINDPVTVYARGKMTTGPKWQFVSSHTGRRSYATNLYALKVDPATIAQWMGHSSPEITIRRYILGSRNVNDDVMKIFSKPV